MGIGSPERLITDADQKMNSPAVKYTAGRFAGYQNSRCRRGSRRKLIHYRLMHVFAVCFIFELFLIKNLIANFSCKTFRFLPARMFPKGSWSKTRFKATTSMVFVRTLFVLCSYLIRIRSNKIRTKYEEATNKYRTW